MISHHHPHALPVRDENKAKFLLKSFLFAGMVTLIFGTSLAFAGIHINVIIPSSAPIWMGTLTLAYMMQVEK